MSSCAVIDLDSTLINTFGYIDNWDRVSHITETRKKDRIFHIKTGSQFMWGTVRPHTSDFLNACFGTFDIVGVWSAGTNKYVKEIVEEVFPQKPQFVWNREKCVDSIDHDGVSIKQKPLRVLHNAYPNIDPKRTLLFDDHLIVCQQDTLYHVHIIPWESNFDGLHKPDDTLKKVATWIRKEVRNVEDYKTISHKGLM